jgi:choice-of-anchor A domain-containing protein
MKAFFKLSAPLLVAAAFSAQADVNSALSYWNVITAGNANLSDPVQGRVFVGGNLTGGNPIATAESGAGATNITFAVGGNISAWANVYYGSTVVGGTSAYIARGNGTLTTGSSLPAALSPVAALTQDSLYWSMLTPNGSATSTTGGLTLNTTAGSSLAVIDITGAQSFNANLWNGINLSLASGVSTVLINVDAGSINEQYAPESSAFQNAFGESHILFNFYNATNITLSGSTFCGEIVAPKATVNLQNGVIGGIMASNLSNIGGVGVELPYGSSGSAWAGSLPEQAGVSAAPEPATLALLPAGAALLWRLRRRK